LHSLVIYNLLTEQLDTVYQSQQNMVLTFLENDIYIENASKVFRYDLINRTLDELHHYESGQSMGFEIYEDSLFFFENISGSTRLKISDYLGLNAQLHDFTDSLVGEVRKILGRDALGGIVFENSNFHLQHTLNFESFETLDASIGNHRFFFPDLTDSSIYIVNDNRILEYDLELRDAFIRDSVATSEIWGIPAMLKIDDQFYIQGSRNMFFLEVNVDSPGMELVSYRKNRPEGINQFIHFASMEDYLFAYNSKGIYELVTDAFKFRDDITTHRFPLFIRDVLYFIGTVENEEGLFKMDGNTPVLLVDRASTFFSIDGGDKFILTGYGPSFEVRQQVYDIAQDELQALDFMNDNYLNYLKVNKVNTLFAISSNSEDATLWKIDLNLNTLIPIFTQATISLNYHFINDDKIIFYCTESDDRSILAFFDIDSEETTYFRPKPNYINYHLTPLELNCRQDNLLFEIANDNCSISELWSTSGTVENTKILLPDVSRSSEPGFEFALHRNENRIFFSDRFLDENYVHYCFDCEIGKLSQENYSEETIVARRFNVGDSVFGLTVSKDNKDNALINLSEGSNYEHIAHLGTYRRLNIRNNSLPYNFIYNVPSVLDIGDDGKELAILSLDPFGVELCYIYEDGTIELLFDLNPGIADAFLVRRGSFYPEQKQLPITLYNENVYFTGFTSEQGFQIYRFPHNGLLSSAKDVSSTEQIVNFDVYPNPSMDFINIRLSDPSNFKYTIFNVDGKEIVKSDKPSKHTTVDISNFIPAIYYLLIEFKGRRLVKSFTKF